MEERKPKFLLIEDERAMWNLMKAMIESLGCELDCVGDGKSALELLADHQRAAEYDALFIDLMLPEITGLELAQRLKDCPHTRNIPRIICTALSSHRDVIAGYQAGGDYYLTKPVTTEQITYALDLLLGEDDTTNRSKRFYLPED